MSSIRQQKALVLDQLCRDVQFFPADSLAEKIHAAPCVPRYCCFFRSGRLATSINRTSVISLSMNRSAEHRLGPYRPRYPIHQRAEAVLGAPILWFMGTRNEMSSSSPQVLRKVGGPPSTIKTDLTAPNTNRDP
jgi:hypothetical protein